MLKLDQGVVLKTLVFVVIAYASYLLILLSLPYIHFEKNVEFLLTKQLIYHLKWWKYSFYVHVFSSPVVILTGLVQFSKYLLQHYPRFHRFCGKTYLVFVVFISGPSALLMALYANGGYLAQISFVVLSTLWMVFSVLSYVKIRSGKIELHANWMLRSYALTLSAVSLRFYAYLFDVFNVGITPKETYILIAYLSWIPNLILAELLIRLGFIRHLMRR